MGGVNNPLIKPHVSSVTFYTIVQSEWSNYLLSSCDREFQIAALILVSFFAIFLCRVIFLYIHVKFSTVIETITIRILAVYVRYLNR